MGSIHITISRCCPIEVTKIFRYNKIWNTFNACFCRRMLLWRYKAEPKDVENRIKELKDEIAQRKRSEEGTGEIFQ